MTLKDQSQQFEKLNFDNEQIYLNILFLGKRTKEKLKPNIIFLCTEKNMPHKKIPCSDFKMNQK